MKTRRAPGQVRDAIFQFFSNHKGDATIAQIQAAVNEQLGAVPASSVRSYLRLNTPIIFRRNGHGRYSLARSKK